MEMQSESLPEKMLSQAICVDIAPHMDRIVELAEGRNAKGDTRQGHDDVEIHILGLKGEFAVAKLLDLPVDTEIYETGGDDGYDLITAQGDTIDVKTRIGAGKDLALYSSHPMGVHASYLALASLDAKESTDVYVEGYVSRRYFVDEGERIWFGQNPRWGVFNENLWDPRILLYGVKNTCLYGGSELTPIWTH